MMIKKKIQIERSIIILAATLEAKMVINNKQGIYLHE